MTCYSFAGSANPRLGPLDVHLIQRRPQAARQLEGIALAPEVHEEESRGLIQHVALMAVATPIAGGTSTLSRITASARGTLS